MEEKKNSQSKDSKKYRIIQPSFYIDNDGRVICESHSQIERIRSLSSLSSYPAFEETLQLEQILTCKTCKHYKKDMCFFSKDDIDQIERDRLSFLYNCNLCGQSIDRPFTIMHSLYNKNKFHVDIPTICCTCFSSLEKDSYLEESRQKMIQISVKLLLIIFLQCIVLFFVQSLTIFFAGLFGSFFLAITLVVTIIGILFYLVFQDARNIMFLKRGRKYYKMTYGKAKERKKGEYVDDYSFN